MPYPNRRSLFLMGVAVVLLISSMTMNAADPPGVGTTAADFTLKTVDGRSVTLSDAAKSGPVVILVLRGNPGYQCPLCTRQVGQFISAAGEIAAHQTQVVLIYPGPAEGLTAKAQEFVGDKTLPEGYHFVTDPDYVFTNAWNLRWNAPRETAYPSTFIVDGELKVRFSHVSRTHGDRTSVPEVIQALEGLQK